ncbi:hypothetical protein [Rugamonas sp.]|uniref:hypothetical protein n=1 Tax=Rugamonas sp. TaxID=1926287 RepID=UPI0025EAD771|nr:hypothetical protein [Rugamonas sp.]
MNAVTHQISAIPAPPADKPSRSERLAAQGVVLSNRRYRPRAYVIASICGLAAVALAAWQ